MRVERIGLGETLVDYRWAWDLQRAVHADVVAGRRAGTVLLLEHASIYTAGRRTARRERPTDGREVIDVDRGGRITWHGPGQLVVYPIVRLAEPVDVVDYVRALEQAVINLAAEWAVLSRRVEGRSGVWVPGAPGEPNRKLAAIGVRVARGVTMHGVAINASPDLDHFAPIVPCGITDAGVTSLSVETGRHVSPLDLSAATERHLLAALERCVATPPTADDDAAPVAAVDLQRPALT